jgi:aspartyl protease family protein
VSPDARAPTAWPAVVAIVLLPALCLATDVRVVAITPGRSVDVVIDHGGPITLEVGESTPSGVKVLRVDRSSAVLQVGGVTKTFPLVADVVVDTGATLTTLSRADAQRAGVDYRRGTPARSMTANGVASGWRVSLDSVRVGDATVRNVDAMVIDSNLPFALLGMSFLGRFDMQRQGQVLVLRRRR